MRFSCALVVALSSLSSLACTGSGELESGAEGTQTSAQTEESGGAEEQGTQSDPETGDSDGDGGPCLDPVSGAARSYDVELLGFAEVGPDGRFTSEGPLDYAGACTLEDMSFAEGELTLELACEHEMPTDPAGARVIITTAATGVPAGLELGAPLSFTGLAYESEGGLELPAGVTGLISDVTNVQRYSLSDDLGAVFLANVHYPGTSHEQLSVSLRYCEAWTGCSDAGVISGYVSASAGQESVDVDIGEVGVVEGSGASWDVSLFQARLDSSDCHFGIYGGVSVVRRP